MFSTKQFSAHDSSLLPEYLLMIIKTRDREVLRDLELIRAFMACNHDKEYRFLAASRG